jgi:peroxiredoxin Q/BCP
MRSRTLLLSTLWATVGVSSALAPLQALSRRSFVHATAASVGGSSLLTAVAANPSIAGAATTATTLETGAKAPGFQLPNSRGEGTTSLSQLIQSKKWTVLYFYPGAFTQGQYAYQCIG